MNSEQLVTEPALCYCRVSRGRDEETNSLNSQAKQCKKFAEENNLNIIDVYKETISGYTDIILRSQLTELLNKCAKDKIGHIIINDLQRLTRSFRDGLLLLDWLHRRGIVLHVVKLQTTQGKMDYLDIVQEFVEAERFYQKYISTPITLHTKSLIGRPHWGYTKSEGKLIKDKNFQDDITEIFMLAIDKKRNKNWTINEIADFIAYSNVTEKNSRSIKSLLRDPIYTGILISKKDYQQYGLIGFPKAHKAYVNIEDFDLINGKIKRQKLKYSDLLFCYNCKQKFGEDKKLYINQDYFQCSNCKKKISHTSFHDEMMNLCAKYSFDEQVSKRDVDSNFDIYHQLESLLKTIITQWESANYNYIFSSRNVDAQVRSKLSAYVQETLKLMEEVSNRIDLHYYIRKELNDNGAALKDLIEKCFGYLFVAVGKKKTIKNSQKRIEPFTTKNLIANLNHKDVSTVHARIQYCIFNTRELLKENPFITDFLAYRIIDDKFNEWGNFLDYLEKNAKTSQIL